MNKVDQLADGERQAWLLLLPDIILSLKKERQRERDAIPFRKNANDFRLKTLVLDTQLLNEQWLSSIIAAQGVSLKANCDTFLKEFYYPPRESTGCFTIMVDKDRKVFGCFLIAQNGIVEKQKRFSLGQLKSRK